MPSRHWKFAGQGTSPDLVEGRHEAGYMVSDTGAKPHQDSGTFIPLPLVNQIRMAVNAWRNAGYPGITGITQVLLEHWNDSEQREYPLFFCQLEAIETLIWLIELSNSKKRGITIPSDGGEFSRFCSKLATGTGKTVVMAMVIAWQAINRVTYPRDERFSQNIFIVAPNLTVRERLSVLEPSCNGNYYDEFNVAPISLREKLLQARVLIKNWHVLNWETEEKIRSKKGVDKRGALSDTAYTRAVLGDMAHARNILVINDEAHHAWRVHPESNIRGVKKDEIDEATKWLGGLDRINNTRGILCCFDFSATPFAPSGKTAPELFPWIVSDFGLNDAIEAGLVKTPRIVVREDAIPAGNYKPRLYHIFSDPEVKDNLNRSAGEDDPLPDFVHNAYRLLACDWEKTKEAWSGRGTPPVMITVANRTETAARITRAFEKKFIDPPSLCDPKGLLHIDSKVLKEAEEQEPEEGTRKSAHNGEGRKQTRKERADFLREQVNTVGQEGTPGEQIQNVISVGMLSEGWDARTVTHIMGLRAFTSQLLCEQVVGRGLRRASYEINEETGLFDPEYVNVFGVPFSFLSMDNDDSAPPRPPAQKIEVKPVDEKKRFEIQFPNIVRVERKCQQKLSVNWAALSPLKIDASTIVEIAEIAPTVNNLPDLNNIETLNLEKLLGAKRRQTLIFQAAESAWNRMKSTWKGSEDRLVAELIGLAEEFMSSGNIHITPNSCNTGKRRHIVLMLSMSKIFYHFIDSITFSNSEELIPVFNKDRPIQWTGDMLPWRTGRPCEYTKKSHSNYCVYDSTWESSDAFELDRNDHVDAWAKNDHVGFEVLYVHNGVVRKYRPDFLIRLRSGAMLVLETKGRQTDMDDSKHSSMREWIAAVNGDGRFGQWQFDVSAHPKEIKNILARSGQE